MLRNTMIGAGAFGLSAALAGYLWTAFEFPFAILLPAAIGWYAITRTPFGARKAWQAALLGGVTFTGVFLVGVFMALTDGSPLELEPWATATLAAAVAGGVIGVLLQGVRGAWSIAAFSSAGMLVASIAMGLMRAVAPASVDIEGQGQYLYFALALGVVGVLLGAATGAGVSWLASHRADRPSRPAVTTSGAPHGA